MFPRLAGLLEVLLLTVIYYAVFDMYRLIANADLFHFRGRVILMIVYALIAYVVMTACDSFNFGNLKLTDIVLSQFISVLIVNFITYLQICLILNGVTTPVPILILCVIDFFFCTLWSYFSKKIYVKKCRVEDVLLVCGTASAVSLKEKLDARKELYDVREVVYANGGFDAVCEAADRHQTIIMNDVPAEMRNDILKYAFGKNKMIFMVPKITDIMMKGTSDISSFDTPLVKVRNEGLLPLEGLAKRCFDIALSSVLLLLLSPAFLIITLLIKAEDGGPVFYRQKRLTKNDRVFEILKFRSMVADAEKLTGAVLAEKDDPRITRVGRALRACRLDELPQLINIFLGDMSFVGPRPERPELAEDIIKDTPEFAFRTKVKGGLTGYAQVYGKYSTTNYDKLRLDLIYIENYSLLLDLKLLFMTPQILFRREASEGVDKKDR